MIANGTKIAATIGITSLASSLYCQRRRLYAESPREVMEPLSGIKFPVSLNALGKNFNLLGHGIRRVTFIKFNAYALGFYMSAKDLERIKSQKAWKSEDQVKSNMEDFLNDVVRKSNVALRLVPARNTNGIHLRNAIEKYLADRIKLLPTEEQKTEAEESMKEFCSAFPKTIPVNSELLMIKNGYELVMVYNGVEMKRVRSAFVSFEVPAIYIRNDAIPELKQGLIKELVG
jgi:hypothetical protein